VKAAALVLVRNVRIHLKARALFHPGSEFNLQLPRRK